MSESRQFRRVVSSFIPKMEPHWPPGREAPQGALLRGCVLVYNDKAHARDTWALWDDVKGDNPFEKHYGYILTDHEIIENTVLVV